MTFHNFVHKAVTLFQSKKEAKHISDRIFRGRAAKCDSEIEDLVASAISDIIPTKYTLLVDYPISCHSGSAPRVKTYYPDIAILCDKELRGIVEVKIDLGYLDPNWAATSEGVAKDLSKAESLTYNKNIGTPKKQKQTIKPSDNIVRTLIVLSGKNDHGRLV